MAFRSAFSMLVTGGIAVALTSACGSDEGSEYGELEWDPPENEAAVGVEDLNAEVGVLNETPIGTVVVDTLGYTLYRFDEDSAAPPTSTCEGACTDLWPPVRVDDDDITADGIDEALVGAIEREDGTRQLTFDGWPMYRYAGDNMPGDVNGQGTEEVWYATAPDGQKIEAAVGEVEEDDVQTSDPGSGQDNGEALDDGNGSSGNGDF